MREPLVALAADEVAAAMLRDDPGGLEAAHCMGCEGRLERIAPAEGGQRSVRQEMLLREGGGPRLAAAHVRS
jgi:hypothetical protein